MSGFPGPSLAAYESGYLGFAPQKELSALGVDCVVAAVSKVPRSAADLSSKNDRNDAARMAKAILSHDVTPVWVPSPEVEGLRDLAAAHDAATARLAAAKQRLLAFLARRGYVVSVNLFFTSFAKQAHRSRKGGFTGCANVFSPIPVTA